MSLKTEYELYEKNGEILAHKKHSICKRIINALSTIGGIVIFAICAEYILLCIYKLIETILERVAA